MNPIRRELLNGLFVLVLASLMSAAFEAFEVEFNLLFWALILMGAAMAVGGYAVFESIRTNETGLKRAEERELEWLRRVGNPARLELGLTGPSGATALMIDAVKALKVGSDLSMMLYFDQEGGGSGSDVYAVTDEARKLLYDSILEQIRRGIIREYKRIICFDPQVFANDRELHSGILRVGSGPGTINRVVADHCRAMIETKGCSVVVAPVVMRNFLGLYGTDKASMSLETVDRVTGARTVSGVMFFYDPPNGEIIEQLRQVVRETEKRMVAVHKIVFPEVTTAPQLVSQ
jgi:hypothetical protein